MSDTDPLALRHGAFVSQVWAQIGVARDVARGGVGPNRAAMQLRRVRHLRRKVLHTHREEMQRHEFSTPAIDAWFLPLEDSLERAERYFAAKCAASEVAKVTKPLAQPGVVHIG